MHLKECIFHHLH